MTVVSFSSCQVLQVDEELPMIWISCMYVCIYVFKTILFQAYLKLSLALSDCIKDNKQYTNSQGVSHVLSL